jgi:uncharacterized integral membrane protein
MVEATGSGEPGAAEEGNGGPVTPGSAPPAPGTNGNGAGRQGGAAARGGKGGKGGTGGTGGTVVAPERQAKRGQAQRSRVSGLWVGLILSAIVLLFLLIFILQNNVPTEVRFLGAAGTLPVGVALLFAAVLGVLLVAIPGGLRILQLRRGARKRDPR